MKITERAYRTTNYCGFKKSLTRCPFHNYIKIGSGACKGCMCYEGETENKVNCSFSE